MSNLKVRMLKNNDSNVPLLCNIFPKKEEHQRIPLQKE